MKRRTLTTAIAVLTLLLITTITVWGAFDWSPPVLVGGTEIQDSRPEAAADSEGNVYVVWTTYPYPLDLMFNHFDGTDWDTPTNISARWCCGWSYSPDVAVGPTGDVHVAWLDGGDGPLHTAYRRYDGSSWSPAVPTGLRGAPISVAEDHTGQVFVAIGSTSAGIQFVVGDGTSWSPPESVVGAVGVPDLSVDENGVVYLAYAQGGIVRYRIWSGTDWSEETYPPGTCAGTVEMFHTGAGESDLLCLSTTIQHWHKDGNGWSEPLLVTTAAKQPSWADATGGPSGTLAAIWIEGDPYGSGIPDDAHVRVWTGSKWLPSENVSNTTNASLWPTIAISSNEQAVAIWQQQQGGTYYRWLTASVAELVFPITVGVDIKPGGYPNCLNIDGTGVIPVAVLGSAAFDVRDIDPSTLQFAGLTVRVKPNSTLQCSVEDVSGDFTNPEGAPDGFEDLVCQFLDDESSWAPGTSMATLTGSLHDGTLIEGEDEICIVP